MDIDFIIDTLEIAIFPNGLKIDNPTFAATKLVESNLVKTNENYFVEPFPPEAPDELIRIKADLKEFSNYELLVSQKKISVIWRNEGFPNKTDLPPKKELIQIIDNLYDNFTVLAGNKVTRAGFIVKIAREDENPISMIKQFLSNDIKENLREALLQLTYDISFDINHKSIKCNRHLVVSKGQTSKAPNRKVVIIQQDLNTLQNESLGWNKASVEEFIDQTYKKSSPEEILKLLPINTDG